MTSEQSDHDNPTRPENKTITPRAKAFKAVADRVGWHVFCDDSYLGYQEKRMSVIVAEYTDMRLTWIGGNGLAFEW